MARHPDYRYTATFETVAHVLQQPEQEKWHVSQASLRDIAGIVPPHLDIEGNPDLLYFAANGAVAGLANKNGDAISQRCALAVHRSALHKFIDVEHKRNDICGVVLHPALTRFDTSEPILDESTVQPTDLFNMAIVGALWKSVNPKLTNYIYLVDGQTGSEALSLSWEIAFLYYDIAVGPRELSKARIIRAEDPEFEIYDKMLRANGGTGRDTAGQDVYRVIDGPALIVGYGIVANPAAEVRGIVALEGNVAPVKVEEAQPAAEPVAATVTTTVDTAVSAGAASAAPSEAAAEKIITSSNEGVTPITTITMKIESLDQLKSQWADIRVLETSAAVEDFVAGIQKGAEEYVTKLAEKENAFKVAEEARANSEKRAAELEASLQQIRAELQQVRDAAAAAEAQAKFNQRMAAFDEKFDLDDEDRKIIAADIRALNTDEEFEAYAKKCEKLMAGKKKGAKPPMDEDETKRKQMEEEAAKKAAAALATAAVIPGQSVANNNNGSLNTTLIDQMKEAFVVKNNGKPVTAEAQA
jgi:hypothetical protein